VYVDIFQLPPKPTDQSQGAPSATAPPGAYNPYSPAVAAPPTAQQTTAPPAPINIGFENLSSMTTLFSHLLFTIIITL